MSNYDSVSDVELTEEHYDFLCSAGAAQPLMEIVQKTASELDVERNSAREEVKSYVFYGEFKKEPSEFSPYGGHFFTALWEGDLYRAFCRADGNNTRALLALFGALRINADRTNRRQAPIEKLRPSLFGGDEVTA